VSIGGVPIRLVDTAGIRQALDEAESIGIQKSLEILADSVLVLVVLDVSQPASGEDEELLRQTQNRPVIVVGNKCDLESSGRGSVIRSQLPTVKASALTGEGIAELRSEILRHIGGETGAQAEAGFLTNVRHQGLVRDALLSLDAAIAAVMGKFLTRCCCWISTAVSALLT